MRRINPSESLGIKVRGDCMKISTKGRYGLRAMVDIAIYSKEAKVSINSIAQRQDISSNYLEIIIALLKKAGYVSSTRGAKGGYALAKDPKDISVGDLLRALEGDLNPIECAQFYTEQTCTNFDTCATKFVWKKMEESITAAVNSISLQDIVEEELNNLPKD